ncbi:MAG: hypothetical protein RLZZ618_3477 [Pseudomonadota bacterium]|jgi:hypothetical protein
MSLSPSIKSRLFASGIHLGVSAIVAALAAILALRIWYPWPYSEVAGGLSLFLLLVSVDVVMGPALTAVIASPGKPRKELRRDLLIIVILQLGAFAYGLHVLASARPVYLSYEVDRMRVVTAADIEDASLKEAPPELQKYSWTGPKLIAAAKPTDPDEQVKSVELALAGFDLSMVPRNWRDYNGYRAEVWQRAKPVAPLLARYPQVAAELERVAKDTGKPVDQLRFLPMASRQGFWVVVFASPDAEVKGYLPVDGFF